jgi:hypothetical protein
MTDTWGRPSIFLFRQAPLTLFCQRALHLFFPHSESSGPAQLCFATRASLAPTQLQAPATRAPPPPPPPQSRGQAAAVPLLLPCAPAIGIRLSSLTAAWEIVILPCILSPTTPFSISWRPQLLSQCLFALTTVNPR